MKKILQESNPLFPGLFLLTLAACNGNNKDQANEAIASIDLKRGEVVLCGPPNKQFGSVGFETSCSEKVKKDFDLALAILHSISQTSLCQDLCVGMQDSPFYGAIEKLNSSS